MFDYTYIPFPVLTHNGDDTLPKVEDKYQCGLMIIFKHAKLQFTYSDSHFNPSILSYILRM